MNREHVAIGLIVGAALLVIGAIAAALIYGPLL